MATIFSNKGDNSIANAIVVAFNQLHDDVCQQGASGVSFQAPTGGFFHRDQTSFQASGSDWQHPSSVLMTVNPVVSGVAGTHAALVDLQGKLFVHFNDDSSHLVKDVVSATGIMALSVPLQTDVTGTAQFANNIKKIFNSHLTESLPSGLAGPGLVQVHVLNDTLNNNSTATATSTGTSQTLTSSIASGVSAHLITGPAFGRLKLL